MTHQLEQLIKHYESLHDGDLSTIGLQPKMDCLGIWTEGWGAVIYDGNNRVIRGIENKSKAYACAKMKTELEAQSDLVSKVSRIEANVRAIVNKSIGLKQHQIDALTDFAYNCGIGSLQSSTALRLINKGDLSGVDALLKWNKGKDTKGNMIELKGLTYRRQSEIHLFKTGEVKFFN